MKKSRKCFVFLGIAFLAFSMISCGSTPKVDESQNNIEDAVNDLKEIEESEENADEINAKALEKAEAARQAAIDSGADKVASSQFVATDALYEAAKALVKTGKNSSKELEEVQKRYEALENYSKILEAKKLIDEKGWASNDQASYDKGCASLDELETILNNPLSTGDEMLVKSKETYGAFSNVIFASYKKLAKEERINAFTAKRDADGVKAAVAAKEEYKSAVDEFRAGDSSYSMQNPEAAYNHYVDAKQKFSSIYEAVSVKRAAAQKAMDEAKARVSESQNYAVSADKKAPIAEGAKIQGIEEQDAVLLEEDKYEDPAKQEVAIPEEFDENAEYLSEENVQESSSEKTIESEEEIVQENSKNNNSEAK